MRFRFRFRWIPFVAAVTAFAISVSLGHWQMRRAWQKEEIAARLSARAAAPALALNAGVPGSDDAEFRRAVVNGEFVQGWPVYLDNRPYKGMAGYYMLMPLRIAGSNRHVLVARGWIRRDVADRARLPVIATPTGMIEIAGVLRRAPGHVLQLGQAEPLRPNAIVQNVSAEDFAKASRLDIAPLLLEQASDTRDGLVREWPKPSNGAEKHRGYAFQWYALAVTAFVFFVVTGFQRGSK